MDRLFEAWLRWPLAARWVSGVGAIWFISALLPALRSSRPAAAFGEYFVALGIHYGLMAGSVALGIWLGPKIADRTGKIWLAWAVGVALFAIGGLAQIPLGTFFGVSARLDEMFNTDCYVDWDGRSNPTVCE